MALAARAMATMAQQVGGADEREYAPLYLQTANQLEDLTLLQQLHLDNLTGAFADFGLNTEQVAK